MKFRPNADMMASVFVHLMLLGLIFLYSEVHQFDPVAADTVPVEIVTPQEAAEVTPEPTPSPSPTPEFQLPSLDKQTDAAKQAQAAKQTAAAKPEAPVQTPAPQPQQTSPPPQQTQAATPAPKPSPPPQRAASAEPPPAPQTPPTPQAVPPSQPVAQQPAQPSPSVFTAPEPDVTVKYGVLLGLPGDISVPSSSAAAPSGPNAGTDNFDSAATEKADVGNGVVAEFRRHLKTCGKLPATLNPRDDVKVKLRVQMKPDGKLAAPPLLLEASASAKGPLLMQTATSALQACQPYGMLPRDRYGEWKVLDVDFTPRDFAP